MWICGYECTSMCAVYLGVQIMQDWRPLLREIMSAHEVRVAISSRAIHGRSCRLEVGAQNGHAHYEAPMPMSCEHAHFCASLPTKLFARGFASCAKFFKNFLKTFGNQCITTPYLQRPESDIARCSRVRHKFFEMIDMRQALYEPYGIRREHKIALGEWWKFMSDILSTRRVTGSKLHIMLTRLMLPT